MANVIIQWVECNDQSNSKNQSRATAAMGWFIHIYICMKPALEQRNIMLELREPVEGGSEVEASIDSWCDANQQQI